MRRVDRAAEGAVPRVVRSTAEAVTDAGRHSLKKLAKETVDANTAGGRRRDRRRCQRAEKHRDETLDAVEQTRERETGYNTM